MSFDLEFSDILLNTKLADVTEKYKVEIVQKKVKDRIKEQSVIVIWTLVGFTVLFIIFCIFFEFSNDTYNNFETNLNVMNKI